MHIAQARTTKLGPVLLLWLAACSGGQGTTAVLAPIATAPRLESARTAGEADALAGELLFAAGRAPATPLLSPLAVADPQLATAVATIAYDHLRTTAFGSGAGPGSDASRRVQRLSLEKGAPKDANGNGSNRDEALRAELERLAGAAGATLPADFVPPLLPWSEASADAAAALGDDAVITPSVWRTVEPTVRTVRLADVGAFLQGRVRAVRSLIEAQRGGLVGETADDGLLGLVLLAQVVGAEEELIGVLSTDGSVLGGFADAHAYDPAAGRRWLPAEVEVLSLGDGSRSYRPRDLASDLGGLAQVLDAAAELAWFSGPSNPSTSVQAVFAGPFAPPPPANPPTLRRNWQEDIQPIIHGACFGCHLGFATGGFLCDTYTSTLQGGNGTRARGFTMVIPGDHQNSFLYRILTAPPFPFSRMPPGLPGTELPATQIATIAEWIDQGALEFPEAVPPPPAPGEDLAGVCFKNLVAMHVDRATGALDARIEADGGSRTATALATGRTLTALAHLAAALPDLEADGISATTLLALCADFAATQFVGADGRVFEQVALEGNVPGRTGSLADQAVLATGLFDAAQRTGQPQVLAAAGRAAAALVGFRDASTGLFRSVPEHSFARYTPRLVADLLAVLRAADAAGIVSAAAAHDQMLTRLLPRLAYASWTGVAGLPQPQAAGGDHGRLPVLAGAILVGPATDAAPADAPITWSQHIRPLLLGKCGDCHFAGAAQGGYRCDTVQLLATPGGENGASRPLVPGDPEASFLFRKLVDRVPATGAQMPLQRTMLDDRARALVRRWIEEGATAR